MIADEIRNAKTECDIYFLLASYIEAVRFGDKVHCGVPEHVTRLPLNDVGDVRERLELFGVVVLLHAHQQGVLLAFLRLR